MPDSARIYKLTITRFRGFETLEWTPAPGMNVLIGGGDAAKPLFSMLSNCSYILPIMSRYLNLITGNGSMTMNSPLRQSSPCRTLPRSVTSENLPGPGIGTAMRRLFHLPITMTMALQMVSPYTAFVRSEPLISRRAENPIA